MYLVNGNKPASGDPFYNTISNGGYSQCIQGEPTIEGLDVLCNCVGGACGFFNKIYSEVTGYEGMKYPKLYCNAEYFIEQAKRLYPDIEIVQEPSEGGIMVWEGIGNLAGHVAGVVRCNSKTQVYTAESGYNSFAWENFTRNKGENGNYGLNPNYYRYLGCLVNPALGEQRSYENAITPNVDRDENKDQIEVKEGITDVRVRTNPSLLGDIIGYATPGVYDYFEKVNADDYDWYRIADDQWMAYDAEWENLYPKKEPKEISLGDTVIVNGIGTASSTGEGAQTGRFVDREMKVIMIAGNVNRPNRYALNQYNKGNVNDPTAVTAWFSINDIKRV